MIGATVDRSSVALEFCNVDKRRLGQCLDMIESAHALSYVPFEGLLAHQVAYSLFPAVMETRLLGSLHLL